MSDERMTLDEYRRQPKPHKYGARPCVVDGIRFDSRREANRYAELTLMVKAGLISDLKIQVPFPIHINGQHVTTYKADFVYQENGRQVVEDAKGMRERVYRLKKKMVRAQYGIEIVET
jgi:hypothetical protein